MRVSFISLFSLVAALSSYAVVAHPDVIEYDARDLSGVGLSARALDNIEYMLERRDLLADFTTRELVDELSGRLERRGNKPSKPKTYGCPYCGKQYPTFDAAKKCATLPQMLGGCKVNQSVRA